MSGSRDLEWTYTVGGSVNNGEIRYALEARVPYGASADGVRAKLGVDKFDLPDSDISLVGAFLKMQDVVGAEALGFSDNDLAVRHAIEAYAALALIPTMPVRTALKEASGTDSFQRDKIDWDNIAAHLQGIITEGILVVLPTYDVAGLFGAIFILASPSAEPFPGG
jgi:hypothetical protein